MIAASAVLGFAALAAYCGVWAFKASRDYDRALDAAASRVLAAEQARYL